MYNVDGFKPIYGKNGKLAGVQAQGRFFELVEFKVWFRNKKRRLFVHVATSTALYHFCDLSEDKAQEWYSTDPDDWFGLTRMKAPQVVDEVE